MSDIFQHPHYINNAINMKTYCKLCFILAPLSLPVIMRVQSTHCLSTKLQLRDGSVNQLRFYLLYFRKVLAFIFIPVIQREMNTFIDMWNSHRIRHQKDTLLPDGVPNHIYNFPEKYGLEKCGM